MSFDDLLTSNQEFAKDFHFAGLSGVARKGLAMVTCMDSRIDPLAIVGLEAGDMKLLRNPGGRVNDATVVSLVLAVHLLGVNRIMVVGHTQCAMTENSEEQLRDKVEQSAGISAADLHIGAIADQRQTIDDDIQRIKDHPLLGDRVEAGGFIYDVTTGLLNRVV